MPQGSVLAEGSLINNRFRVLRLIGGGAMARVYQVEHTELGTIHAVKEQQGEDEDSENAEKALRMALSEARLLGKLSHPNIPKVTDSFRENGKVYFVMDFIEGQNLKSILDRNGGRALEMLRVLRWGMQICDVLRYLHRLDPPIIFRDIKPSNIILRPDDNISMVDFGIARTVKKHAASDTIVFGSPGYAPPEQYGQGQTDPRSDIYALGATLHHLLSGRDPSSEPFKWPPLRTLNPRIPIVLEKLIMRCLEMEPNKRPETADEVYKRLEYAVSVVEEEMGGAPASPSPSTRFTPEQLHLAGQASEQAVGTGVIGAGSGVHGDQNFVAYNPAEVRQTTQHISNANPVLQQTMNASAPAKFPVRQFLFTILLLCTIPIIPGSLFMLLARQQLAEKVPFWTASLLVGMVCISFILGIRPMRPTKLGMGFIIGGAFCLICLAWAFFNVTRPPVFAGLAAFGILLILPAAYLLNTSETT